MALDVESLARRVHVADGAWSTILAARCPGEARRTEMLALTQPQATAGLIEQYLAAGAELITTHTFGVTPGNLKRWEVQSELAEVIAGICAVFRRQVPGKRAALLGDIGPSGKILAVREAPEAELAAMYRAQAAALAAGGVDAILLETFSELAEILLALRAVREVTALPVIASMSFDSGPQRTRTIMGAEAGQCAGPLQDRGLAKSLQQRQRDGHQNGDLIHLLPALIPLLAERLQGGNDRDQQLKDNGGRDVGVNTHRHDREGLQRAAGHQVQEAQQGVLAEELVEHLGIDARHRHGGRGPVDGENAQRDQNLLAQVRQAHGVAHGSDHVGKTSWIEHLAGLLAATAASAAAWQGPQPGGTDRLRP